MPSVIFHHNKVNGGKPLVIETGMDEVAWSYNLNVAKFNTYGGEVVQICSCYIDDLQVDGTIRTYEEAEEIGEFFMKYFIIATQGSSPTTTERFEQVPMTMEYPQREWLFHIQPLKFPAFTYELEVVAPKWQMMAHIVDDQLLMEDLRKLVVENKTLEAEKFGAFTQKGLITPSALAANPATNPFLAPLAPGSHNASGEIEFNPHTQKEITEGVTKLADYYSKLLPSYMEGDGFKSLVSVIGSKPAYGRKATSGGEEEGSGEAPEELIETKNREARQATVNKPSKSK